jgi:hypothetical protein
LLANNPHIQLGFFGFPVLSVCGFLIMVTGIYGWSFEPAG